MWLPGLICKALIEYSTYDTFVRALANLGAAGDGAVPRLDGLARRVQEWDGRAGFVCAGVLGSRQPVLLAELAAPHVSDLRPMCEADCANARVVESARTRLHMLAQA